jgi:hypothetical protein
MLELEALENLHDSGFRNQKGWYFLNHYGEDRYDYYFYLSKIPITKAEVESLFNQAYSDIVVSIQKRKHFYTIEILINIL